MNQTGFKFFFIILIFTFLTGCKNSSNFAKHRPPSVKKTFRNKNVTIEISNDDIKISKNKKSKNNTKSDSKNSSSTNPNVNKVIKEARSYTGVKYKYGGMSRSGMDCSGLMCTSYKAVGLNLPRSSTAQSSVGKRVYIGELQPGDLVFFATGSSKSKITHVGLITNVVKVNGDVRFIHASTSKGVREDNVFDPYWRPRYVKAVRPLK